MIFFFRSPNCTQVKLYGTQVNILNFLQLHQPKLVSHRLLLSYFTLCQFCCDVPVPRCYQAGRYTCV